MPANARDRYLDLLGRCLTRELFIDEEAHGVDLSEWPSGAPAVRPLFSEGDGGS